MTYNEAIKLHNGDEVTLKGSEIHLTVVDVENDREHKDCFIRCNDGDIYYHTAIK